MDQGDTGAMRRLRLAPELASAGLARRLVATVLQDWELGHLADDVALGVSELVANAVLHAHTDLEVALERRGAGVRAEVRDGSAQPVSLPWHPSPETPGEEWGGDVLDTEAMTGRGLLVVASVADAWGVDEGNGGKTVWMEIGTGAPPAALPAAPPAPPAPPADTAPVVPGAPGAEVVAVRLVAVPVRLALANDANLDDLVREFQVLTMSDQETAHPGPQPLLRLSDEVLDRYAEPRLAARAAARAAGAAGLRLFDFVTGVPIDVVPDMWHLTLVLEQVASYCRQGALLSLAPSEELSAFRRWWVSEIERQVRGATPRPCPFPVAPPDEWAPDLEGTEDALAAERAARTVAEEAGARLAGLQELTAGLSAAVTSQQVADVVLGRGLALLGATTGSFSLLQPDGATVEIVGAVGYHPWVAERWHRFNLSDDVPASETIRTGQPVY
ncbi:MAG TPA: ATP-binding protein, partial [Acidimicrobiales bacterium]|nr:ATP-binding protein [Acidimicrobiales bacterium]